ncbi:unnamed protein product [Nesidiocoris tenuis]|uniref:Uncharacterized protein n=1 Tax=Nesidiocoris tenuis TaxID=355587 RepID=A0A6H5GRX5_9HEMI|nr:unnamed protein product [Nesidiocoris tenuis]
MKSYHGQRGERGSVFRHKSVIMGSALGLQSVQIWKSAVCERNISSFTNFELKTVE